MPTKTKTEYETVEKTIEYTECGVPSCLNTDEDKELIELAVNPRYEYEEHKDPVIVEAFDEREDARLRKDKEIAERRRREAISQKPPGFVDIREEAKRKYAFGYDYSIERQEAQTDASFYVCQDCLKNHFEAVPDRYNPENVKEIEAKDGRVVVEQEENYLIPYDAVIVVGAILSVIILFFALTLI
jgi:hypothetical protein